MVERTVHDTNSGPSAIAIASEGWWSCDGVSNRMPGLFSLDPMCIFILIINGFLFKYYYMQKPFTLFT